MDCKKVVYKNRKQALLGAADRLVNAKNHPSKMRVYKCPTCWKWHVASGGRNKNSVQLYLTPSGEKKETP